MKKLYPYCLLDCFLYFKRDLKARLMPNAYMLIGFGLKFLVNVANLSIQLWIYKNKHMYKKDT